MPQLRAGAAFLIALSCSGANHRWDQLGEDIERARRALRIDGVAAVVVEDGRVVWRQGFGGLSPCHRLNVASITKTMGAVLALQQVEAGRLRLDERVPGLCGVTVRQLLSHTSRGRWAYDNQRYGLMTRIVERRAGAAISSLLRDRIFTPAGLRTALPSASVVGGVRASADDLAAYAIALDGNELISERSKQLMWSPVRSGVPYGLGWFVEQRNGLRVVWHYGRISTSSSLIVKIPERRASLVVLANSPALGSVFRMATLALSPVGASFLNASLAAIPDEDESGELLAQLPAAVARSLPKQPAPRPRKRR